MLINLYIYVIVIVTYNIYNYIKDLPFHYITQTNFSLCEKMNSTFCIRISYFVMAIVLYFLTIKFINLTLPQDAPKVINTITNDKPSFFGFGSLVGSGISILSFIFNIILGFSTFNGFKHNSVVDTTKNLITIFIGMMMTSFSEELIYRGLLIGVTKQFLNTNICVILSALVFGYVHVKSSFIYGIVAFISGIVLGLGYLHYGLYWCIGLHALFNFVETSLYTITNIKVSNKLMGGERKTPDDDGMMTALVELIGLYSFYYFGYF
jgi:membrane protease YdiL (CAAX protease family)